MFPTRRSWPLQLACAAACLGFLMPASAQTPQQPKVAPGPNEPDWVVLLRDRYGLDMFEDLVNPVTGPVAEVPGLFRKAGDGPVTYRPMIALGLETTTRGGWYVADGEAADAVKKDEVWSYTFKNTTADLRDGTNLPPPVEQGAVDFSFDPGDEPFGLWVSNDQFEDGGAYSEPARVAAINDRLAGQPYKVMIYPYVDPETGERVPNSYLLGWEYSTNDDFQDVVCRLENVVLIRD